MPIGVANPSRTVARLFPKYRKAEEPMGEDRTAPETGTGVVERVRSAIEPRAALLLLGVMFIHLAFVFSYVGAFHEPKPHGITMGVAAPSGAPPDTAEKVVERFNEASGHPVDARVVGDESDARAGIRDRTLAGALILGDDGSARLLVASAEGAALADALQTVVETAAKEQQMSVTTDDIVPAGAKDSDGVVPFFLALGLVIGGYLAASVLTISLGAKAPTFSRALVRLVAVAVYAVVSSISAILIVEHVFGALTGHFWGLVGFGSLLVFAICVFTMALQALTGVIGIGIAMFLFVVLGSPSAGGAYPGPLLPSPWREIGPFLAPGAGTSGMRGISYFGGSGLQTPVLVLCGYLVLGVAVLVVGAIRHQRRAEGAATAR